MEHAQVTTLFAAIPSRHSVRSFDGTPLTDADFEALNAACTIHAGHSSGVRLIISRKIGGTVFKGFVASYGKIVGASDVLLMVGDESKPHFGTLVGLAGEKVILEATGRGVGTCWVSGSFRPGVAQQEASLSTTERVLAVSPLGYALASGKAHDRVKSLVKSAKRRPLSDLLVPGGTKVSELGGWVLGALEAARLAPSAINRQPWRFRVEGEAVTVLVARGADFGMNRRLDCGIAMAHIELAAAASGIRGSWAYGSGSEVATFHVTEVR